MSRTLRINDDDEAHEARNPNGVGGERRLQLGRGLSAVENQALQQTGAASRRFVLYCLPGGPGC